MGKAKKLKNLKKIRSNQPLDQQIDDQNNVKPIKDRHKFKRNSNEDEEVVKQNVTLFQVFIDSVFK